MLTMSQLNDRGFLDRSFRSKGLNENSIARRLSQASLISNELAKLSILETQKVAAFFVPGRIEVLGKHTDYAGGKSLTCAIDRGFLIAAVPRTDSTITVTIVSNGNSSSSKESVADQTSFEIASSISPTVGHWSNYPMTVARRLAMNFYKEALATGAWRGADIVLTSDLPQAAGLSSSSALIIAIFKVLATINDLVSHPAYQKNITSIESLAEYLGSVENGRNYRELLGTTGVGTLGGSEDHVAILCSEPGFLKCYAYAPTEFLYRAQLPEGWCFAVGSSGVLAEKTGEVMQRYNRLSRMTAEVTTAWRKQTGRNDLNLAAMIQSPSYTPQELLRILSVEHSEDEIPHYTRRIDHFVAEDQKFVPAAIEALTKGDITTFGNIVNLSHDFGDSHLDNQIPETRTLVKLARELGAVGSSAFGAGFGGSVYAVIRESESENFCEAWRAAYMSECTHARAGEFFLCQPSTATIEIG